MNYPDIKLLLENTTRRDIPVMIEVKGTRNKLEKVDKEGSIVGVTTWASDGKFGKDGKPTHVKGDPNYNTVKGFAVNGALHYGQAVLNGGYDEVIVVGVNGCELKDGQVSNHECKAYYVSKKNNHIPKLISELTADDWSLFAHEDALFERLDHLNLSETEIEALTAKTESELEGKIKRIHQSLYDDVQLKTALTTNEKLYLFCGLIMAGLQTAGVRPLDANDLHSNNSEHNNNGIIILSNIESFLYAKQASPEKVQMISGLLRGVFTKSVLWKPKNGESLLKVLFHQVKEDIIPLLESNLHLDFTGRILNSLNDWVSIDNDAANDVVLTPRYVTQFMAKCARTNKDSFVWDKAMGSAGFLVSAMDLMIKDARETIVDPDALDAKIKKIKEKQLLGIEILGNIYILAVLNMILMGDYTNARILDKIKNETIQLPGKPGADAVTYSQEDIDWDYVESYIHDLEQSYIHDLEQSYIHDLDAYLKETGLDDYHLTDAEHALLEREPVFGAFAVIDLFDVINTKSIRQSDIRDQLQSNNGSTPYITASDKNNAIFAYIDCPQEWIDEGNCIFIGGKTTTVTYQEYDFCSNDSHNLALYLKNEYARTEHIQLYLVAILKKAFAARYQWSNALSKTKIKAESIQLPLKPSADLSNYTQDDIDWDYMASYVRVMEKRVIADVVDYKNEVIALTKDVCHN